MPSRTYFPNSGKKPSPRPGRNISPLGRIVFPNTSKLTNTEAAPTGRLVFSKSIIVMPRSCAANTFRKRGPSPHVLSPSGQTPTVDPPIKNFPAVVKAVGPIGNADFIGHQVDDDGRAVLGPADTVLTPADEEGRPVVIPDPTAGHRFQHFHVPLTVFNEAQPIPG